MCWEARGRGRARNTCACASRSHGLIFLMKRARSYSMWVTWVLNRGWYRVVNLYAESECSHLLSGSKSLSSAITGTPLCSRLKVSSHFRTDDPRWKSLTLFFKKESPATKKKPLELLSLMFPVCRSYWTSSHLPQIRIYIQWTWGQFKKKKPLCWWLCAVMWRRWSSISGKEMVS